MQRKHERAPVAIEAVLSAASGNRESRISDLSLGGCYVESLTDFSPGEAVVFDLIDSAGVSFAFTGVVAYVLEGFGFGLQFTDLKPHQIEFLEKAIANP